MLMVVRIFEILSVRLFENQSHVAFYFGEVVT